jgi:hypothetical protein
VELELDDDGLELGLREALGELDGELDVDALGLDDGE